MVIWFAVLAGVDLINIFAVPAILAALNPFQGVEFCLHHGWLFVALGAVVLALTGAEGALRRHGAFRRPPDSPGKEMGQIYVSHDSRSFCSSKIAKM